jgi:fatty acid-binding protein DegV
LEKKIRACFDRAEMYLTELGPVIGTHDGPGAIEIAFRTDLN